MAWTDWFADLCMVTDLGEEKLINQISFRFGGGRTPTVYSCPRHPIRVPPSRLNLDTGLVGVISIVIDVRIDVLT